MDLVRHGHLQVSRGRTLETVIDEMVEFLIDNDYRIFFDNHSLNETIEDQRERMKIHLDTLICLVYDYDVQ